MRFKSLAVVVGALFILAACSSDSMEDSSASGDGAKMDKMAKSGGKGGKRGKGKRRRRGGPVGFSITAGSQQDFVINVGDRVFYNFDKSNLRPAARTTLEKQAAWLKKFPQVRVAVEGHADERGTREYNLALGERRANAAKDFLVALGIAPARIRVVSFGKERPVALGHDEASWSQNRRAVTAPTSGLPGS